MKSSWNKTARRLVMLTIFSMIMTAFSPFSQTGRALAASVTSANFTAGGVLVGSTRYAKQGQPLTLSVATTNDTKCVSVSGAFSGINSSSTGQSSWTFVFNTGSGNGPQSVTVSAGTGKLGSNCTGIGGTATASFNLDNAGPSVSSNASPAPNSAGWNNSDVTVTWTASDGTGVGFGSGPTPSQQTFTVNGNYNVQSTAVDALGNQSPNNQGKVTVHLDKTLPTITGSRSPAANANGWNNTDVQVSFNCSDPGQFASGIASCGPDVTVSSEGANQSATGTASDVADNTANATVSGMNIDKTDPSLSGAPTTAPNAAGWYNSDVTIHWTCSDALSGIAGSCPADSTISGDGTGQQAAASVSDRAGNSTNATSSPLVNRDTVPPTTMATAPGGWNNQAVTVSLNASDNLSDVAATYYILDGGAQTAGTSVSINGDAVHTLEFWSVDNADNEESHHTVQVMIDGTPPTINHTLSPAANGDGWNNTDVTINFVCSDATSGIASCAGVANVTTASATVTDEGANQDYSHDAVDNAGNSATDPATVNIDKTDPTIEGSRSPLANSYGWNNTDVTVQFACDDDLSGVADCPADSVVSTEGMNQSVSGTATDIAGNTASDTVGNISIDKTDPSLSGAATTNANQNGWYNGDVVVAWSCSDALSGIAGSCPPNSTIMGEGNNLSASAMVSDRADNETNTTVSGIKIDRTAPSISGAPTSGPNGNGWYDGPVTVHFDCADGLSGIPSGGCPADVILSSDGAGQSVIRSVTDAAGNSASVTVSGINIDQTAPVINGNRTPAANANGWNNGPVTVSFSCSDATSGIPTGSCPGSTTLSSEGAGQSASGTVYDLAGNSASATVSGINIDLTPPTIGGSRTPAANANGWNNTNVTVSFSCADALSGVDTCSSPTTLTTDGANQSVTGAVTDNAGNSASATVSGINIDKTLPTLNLPANITVNSSSLSGAVVTYSATASDGLSAFAGGVNTTNATCSPASGSTFAPGTTTTVNCSATDRAGNTRNGSFTVTVNAFYFAGFFQPIDNLPVVNVIRGGSTVPVKWKLYLYQGGPEITNVASVMSGWPRYTTMNCDTNAPLDEVETTSTGSTTLRYDTSGQQFIYNWQTPSTPGVCLRLDVKFVDNTVKSANFKLR